jgi:hypothetical protein
MPISPSYLHKRGRSKLFYRPFMNGVWSVGWVAGGGSAGPLLRSQGSSLGRAFALCARDEGVRFQSSLRPDPAAVLGSAAGACYRLANLRRAPGVGRCLRQRHVHSAGPLGDRSLPRMRLLRFLGRMARGTRALPGWQRPGAAGEDSGQQARWFR